MRTFIVMGSHDIKNQFRPDITLEMHLEDSVESLLNALNKKYGSNTFIWEADQWPAENREASILEWISESNGDGDWYWMIGEVVGQEFKMLLE